MGTFSQMTMRISTIMTQSPAVFVLRRPWMMMALACAGIAGAAQAQAAELSGEAAASPVQSLAPVVVTASGYDQSIADAPASITVLTHEELARQPFNTLQDALRNVEGVSIVGANANKQDISIRGMPGKYTLILVDGKRQGTREMLNREELGMVQASQIPPLAAIERIEVVRGPMSSLYGSDAIGGVVNIITRKVPQAWTGSINLGATLQQHSELGNSRQADFYLAGPIKEEKLGLQLFGKSNQRTEADVVDGSYGIRDRGLTARLTLTPTKDQDIQLEAGQDEYNRYGTVGKSLAATETGDYRLKNRHTHYSISHEGRWDFGTTNVSLQREEGKASNTIGDKDTTSYPDTRLVNTTLDATLTLPLPDNMLKVGGQYIDTRLYGTDKEAASTAARNTVSGLSTRSWALFGEDEWAVTDNLSLTGGVRLDDHERYGQHWSPRGYAVYHLSQAWTLKGGVSRAFRAPELRQSSADYIQATGGAVGAPRGSIAGNPDLKPETSTTTEIGLHYQGDDRVAAGVTLFNNEFKNKIYSQCVTGCAGASGATYEWGNIGRATLRGVETSLTLPLSRTVTLTGNYTYTQSKRKSDDEVAYDGTSLQGQPLDRTPRHVLNLRADWRTTDALSLYASANVQSEQYWANYRNVSTTTRRRPGATTFDLGGSYELNKHVTFRLAMMNLTDKRVPVDYRSRTTGLDGNWQVDEGRRLWLNTSVSF